MEQQTNTPTGRPVFLTILCIVSWLWQLIVGAFLVFIIAGSAAGGATGEFWTYNAISLVTLVLTFIGVVQMWKLRRMGYYLYVGAYFASTINEYYFDGVWKKLVMVIGLILIALYGVNLKRMK